MKFLISVFYTVAALLTRLGGLLLALLCLEFILWLECKRVSSSGLRREHPNLVRDRFTHSLEALAYSLGEVNGNARLRFKLGSLYSELGRWKQAELALHKSLSLSDNGISIRVLLANVIKEQGRSDEAIEICRQALTQDDRNAAIHKTLADALGAQSRYDESWAACNKALQIQPDFAEGHAVAGWLHLLNNQLLDSHKALDRAIFLDPDCFSARCIRIQLLTLEDELEAALAEALEAIRIKPWLGRGYASLGIVQLVRADLNAAEQACRIGLAIDPSKAGCHNTLGNVFDKQGKLEQAEIQFRKTIELDPSHAETHKNLGVVLQQTGKIDEAIACYQHALSIRPDYADAHRGLAFISRHTEYDDAMCEMERLATATDVTELNLMQLSFGLGKAYDDLKEYDTAFAWFTRGNELKRKTMEYSIEDDVKNLEKIKTHFSSTFCRDHQDQGCMDETPVFVLGMPRSGTSLVEQILAAHPDVFGAGELSDLVNIFNTQLPELTLDGATCRELGKDYVNSVRSLCPGGQKRIVDKMPFNFKYIGFIKLILPRCRIIHCTRDSLDTCVSNFKSYFTHNIEYAFDLGEIGRFYRLYEDVMKHWEHVFPDSIHTVSLQSMVDDQEGETRKLYEFLGLPWDESGLRFYELDRPVRTASVLQVRRPIYRSSLDSWKRYEKHLEPLFHGLSQPARDRSQ